MCNRIESSVFGAIDGRSAQLFHLKSKSGIEAKITNYGATVTHLWVPDRSGDRADVVLGFDRLEDYPKHSPYFGAIVGRVANRIEGAGFTLGGRRYELEANEPPHHLHGGKNGFHTRIWRVEATSAEPWPSLTLSYVSSDGEEGYPGTLRVRVVYALTNDAEFTVEMMAESEAPTLVNLAHHSYWNLSGHDRGTVLDHELRLYADEWTPGCPLVPDGRVSPVAGTPQDFTHPKPIGRDLERAGGVPLGYDHNWVVAGKPGALRPVADVFDPASGRRLSLSANQPGVQFYSGNFLDGTRIGKGGVRYPRHAGLCLETQAFPNAARIEAWRPQVVLDPGRRYYHRMVHRFSW